MSTSEGKEKMTYIPIVVMTLPIVLSVVFFIGRPVTGRVKMCCTIEP